MATIKCENCSNEISEKAATCPKCGHPNKKAAHLSRGQIFLYLIAAGGGLWWWVGGGFDHQVAHDMKKIENQVATDFVDQYNIAKRQGDVMQVCIQAGIVTAAYLQAKNEESYQHWKRVEAVDCERAGLPRQ
jgi:hypothetical protein